MKMQNRWLKLVVVAMVCLLMLSGLAWADREDGVIAKVADVKITVHELKREMQRILPLNSTYHSGVSRKKLKEIQQKATDNLVERSYKVKYAMDNKVAVDDSEIEKKLEQVREKFNSEEELLTALESEGLDGLRSSIYRMLLAKNAEMEMVRNKAAATDAELKQYYEEKKEMFFRPKRYRASHILVRVDPTMLQEQRVELLVKAEELTERAQAGENFYNLAYYNSDEDSKFVGGDIGYFHSGQVVKEFEDAIKDLTPGDIVGPVETLSGFHIIQLTEVEEPRQMTYDEVADRIRKMVEEKRRDALYEEWMSGLKEKYPAEVYLQ